MDNTEEQKEPKYNIEGPIVLDKIDLSQFNMSDSDSSPKRKRIRTMRRRRGIDMDVCVSVLTCGAICNDMKWRDMVNALPSADTVTIADNAKILPKEFYIGMALMLDYETYGETKLTTDDKLFETIAEPVDFAMRYDDGYVDDENSLKYVLAALCNVYNIMHVGDSDEDVQRRRIISHILKFVCTSMGHIFGDWESIITKPVVELAANVAIQMGSSSPYIVVYEKMKIIASKYPAITDKNLSGIVGYGASSVESEVMAVLLFFTLLTMGVDWRNVAKINIRPETIAAMTDLETKCEVALMLMSKITGASPRYDYDINDWLTHLKRQYVLEHPSGGIMELDTIITATEDRISKEDASPHKPSIPQRIEIPEELTSEKAIGMFDFFIEKGYIKRRMDGCYNWLETKALCVFFSEEASDYLGLTIKKKNGEERCCWAPFQKIFYFLNKETGKWTEQRSNFSTIIQNQPTPEGNDKIHEEFEKLKNS